MSLTLGSDIIVNSKNAGFVPGISTTSPSKGFPNGLSSTTPPTSPRGQSQTFDRLLQKIEPINTPHSPKKSVSSAAAHQSQDAGNQKTDFTHKQVSTHEQSTHHRQRSYNQRTAGLSSIEPQQIRHTASASDSASQDTGKLSFWDIIDVINPLQHIPVLGTLYRSFTGDQINAPARILGGALYGGPIGAAAGVVNSAVASHSGRDIGQNVFAMVRGDSSESAHIAQAQMQIDTSNGNFASLQANEIQWSQPSNGSANPPPPRLTDTQQAEIIWAGPRIETAHTSPPLHRSNAARHNLTGPSGSDNTDLASASQTHSTYPMQDAMHDNGVSVHHSLHTSPKPVPKGATPAMSEAMSMEERNRKEIPNAGQESVGSPMLLNLQEASAEHKESLVPSKPIASDTIPQKMMEALEKYQSLKLERTYVGQK